MPQDNTSSTVSAQAGPQVKDKPSGYPSKAATSQVPYVMQRFTAESGPWHAPGVVVGIVKSSHKARGDDDRSTVATQGSGK
ncbi:hypothetical protein ACHAPV_003301 [Trichoderma viride]